MKKDESLSTFLNDILNGSIEIGDSTGKDKSDEIKKESLSAAKKYQNAFAETLNNLPAWRKRIVQDSISNGDPENRIYLEFVKLVIENAEKGE